MDKIISNYIKYKFIFSNNINHSAYLYQKVFRSIYGYTQNVTKKDKKTYLYQRPGVLENIPYIKSGKNSIVIPIDMEHSIINFFNTGKSPIHNFREKGEWTIDYTIEKIEINDTEIIRSIDNYIDSLVIISLDGSTKKLLDELNKLILDSDYLLKYKKANKDNLTSKIRNIKNIDWIIKCKDKSDKIKQFLELCNKINDLFYNSNKAEELKNKTAEIDLKESID